MPTYPLSPGNRFQLDVDGTFANVKMNTSTTVTDLTNGQLASMVGMAGAAQSFATLQSSGTTDINLIFPELRSIAGLRWTGWSARGADFGLSAMWSADTTDGLNGTWTAIPGAGGGQALPGDSISSFRGTAIQTFVQTGVKALKLRMTNFVSIGYAHFVRDIHVYGTRATTGDHLHFWDPTQDYPLSYNAFDYGDAVRGSAVAARTFRVKNVSSTLSAAGTVLSFASHAGVAFTAGQVSLDGTNWSTQVTLPTLAPGAVSALLYVRATGDSTVAPQARAGRVMALPASWA